MPLAGNENEEGKIKATYVGMIKDKTYFRKGENLEGSHKQNTENLYPNTLGLLHRVLNKYLYYMSCL